MIDARSRTIPLICGPTAGGKSDLAIELALTLREKRGVHAEVVTADAFQVYRGLDIGTAKPTIEERRGVAHHLIDVIDPINPTAMAHQIKGGEVGWQEIAEIALDFPGDGSGYPATPWRGLVDDVNAPATEWRGTQAPIPRISNSPTPADAARTKVATQRFSVEQWLMLATRAMDEIRSRAGRDGGAGLPIVVGGTHLYVKALLDGLFEGPAPDAALRELLNAMDAGERRRELERVDPVAAERIHPNDVRRTVRALEVFRQTGVAISDHQRQWDRGNTQGPYRLVILDWEVEAINARINARVKQMMERGLYDEVVGLVRQGALSGQAGEALGYKQLVGVVAGSARLDDAVEQIKIETRRFAKNQRTWLRRLRATPGAVTIRMPTDDLARCVETIIASLEDPGTPK